MEGIASLFTQILAVFQQILGPLFDWISQLFSGLLPS